MKITATKLFTFDMAHTLPGHEGLCRNLHGHTYKLEVTVSRVPQVEAVKELGPSEGMIVDFSDLKKLVQREIIEPLDHATMIFPVGLFEEDLLELLRKHNMKVVESNYRPTAELMANDFMHRLSMVLKKEEPYMQIERIRLWETPTAFAEVSRDEI